MDAVQREEVNLQWEGFVKRVSFKPGVKQLMELYYSKVCVVP